MKFYEVKDNGKEIVNSMLSLGLEYGSLHTFKILLQYFFNKTNQGSKYKKLGWTNWSEDEQWIKEANYEAKEFLIRESAKNLVLPTDKQLNDFFKMKHGMAQLKLYDSKRQNAKIAKYTKEVKTHRKNSSV